MRTYFKILLSLLLISASFAGRGQIYVDRSSPAVTAQDARLSAKYNLKIPVVSDTSHAFNGGLDSLGLIIYSKSDKKMYIRDSVTGGHKWTAAGSGGSADSTIFATLYRLDTTRARLDKRITDSSAALRGLISSGFDSTTSQGGGFHTQPYNDARYKRLIDSLIGTGSYATIGRLYKVVDSLTALMDTTINRSTGATGLPIFSQYNVGRVYGLNFPRVRDTSAAATQYAGDSALTIATHDTTSANALQSKAQADTAKQALRNADALKKNNSDSTGAISYVPRNQIDTFKINNRAAIALKLDSVRRVPGKDSVYEYYSNGTKRFAYRDTLGAGSTIYAGFGLTKLSDSATIASDTINLYYLINPVLGLNNKIVIDGNSNSVGQNLENGPLGSYGRKVWRNLDSSLAVYAYTNVGLSGITTPQMITRGAAAVDTARDLTKTKLYLLAWEGENDASANPGSSSLTLATNLNTYWSARKTAGWPIVIGATGLPKTTAAFNGDSLLNARIDSMNLALVNSHTSDYFINFSQSPWLNNYRSHAGFLADLTHLNQSGTRAMADLFTNVIKADQSQPFKTAPRPVFWGGNSPDRSMLIGPINNNGGSLIANNIPVFDWTQYGGIAMVGTKIPEFSNSPNVAIDLIPRFGNNSALSGWKNYDIRLNQNAEWTSYGLSSSKYAFWQPGLDAVPNLCNFGIGPDVFAKQDVRQSTFSFNTALGNRIFQATTLGNYNTFVGGFGSDAHITSSNTFVSGGLNVGTIGDGNTFVGARGTINNSITLATNLGYNNNVQSSSGITIGNSITAQASASEGGSIIIGQNITDGGFKSYVFANRPFGVTDANPTANGQMIIGGIYNPSGKEIRYFTFAGHEAAAAGVQTYLSPVTITVGGVAGGGSNTNLAASGAELRIYGSLGTGNAASGDIVLGTGVKGASGTTKQSIGNVLRIDANQLVSIGEPTVKSAGFNIKKSINVNKDSILHTTYAAGMEVLVVDTPTASSGQVVLKRAILPSSTVDVNRVSPIDSMAKSANGIQITANNLVPQSADGSFPGMVSTGNQSFGGIKTFLSNIIAVMYMSSSTPSGSSGGLGAGTSPTITLSGSDQDGLITVTTGTSPSSGADILQITTSINPPTTGPCVTLTPGNANAAALSGTSSVYVTSSGPYTFKLVAGSTALAASTQYKWYYHMGGN